MKFWLLTPTLTQLLRLAILKTILRRRKKRINNNNDDDNNSSSKPQWKSKHRLQRVVDYKPGDRLKEGTQIFILLSVQQKVGKKVGLHILTKQLTTFCVDVVFHRNFSSAD